MFKPVNTPPPSSVAIAWIHKSASGRATEHAPNLAAGHYPDVGGKGSKGTFPVKADGQQGPEWLEAAGSQEAAVVKQMLSLAAVVMC